MRKREYLVSVKWVKDDLPHSAGDTETVTIEATSKTSAREIAEDKYGDVAKVTDVKPRKALWYGR